MDRWGRTALVAGCAAVAGAALGPAAFTVAQEAAQRVLVTNAENDPVNVRAPQRDTFSLQGELEPGRTTCRFTRAIQREAYMLVEQVIVNASAPDVETFISVTAQEYPQNQAPRTILPAVRLPLTSIPGRTYRYGSYTPIAGLRATTLCASNQGRVKARVQVIAVGEMHRPSEKPTGPGSQTVPPTQR